MAKKREDASPDLLMEIGCEDLPARYVLPLAQALRDGAASGLTKRGVPAGASRMSATPRRIAVLIEGVAARQAEQKIERTGPALAAAIKDGQPTPAALGFAKSCGVAFAELGRKDGKLYFVRSQPGRATGELLPEIFEETLKAMDALVPKRMRWGSGEETFVRPVQWLVCMLGNTVVPLQRFGLMASNKTYGHRFHAPKAIALKSSAEYERKLKTAKVWADFNSRKAEIDRQIKVEAQKLKGSARIAEALLEEVTALVEWPVAISGRMDDGFMALPPEVIIATIEHNQRYFPVFGADKKLLPAFITVSNIQSKDFKQVIAGNERVVRPRLTDALFFWEQDRKKKLADYLPELDRVTFQKELGSVGDKARRIGKLATHIAGLLSVPEAEAERAAALCKADLVTRMVFEFPELQGTMGGYYAVASGEPQAVGDAVREHYQPTQSGAPIPATRAGQIVALADKLDTIVGVIAAGQQPTATKDPFALRRAAIGVVRICVEGDLSLDLEDLLRRAAQLLPENLSDRKDAAVVTALTFIEDRFFNYFESLGATVHQLEAVRRWADERSSKDEAVYDFLDLAKRIRSLQALSQSTELRKLGEAHKRIRNILKQAGSSNGELQPENLKQPEERSLHEALTRLASRVDAAAKSGAYEAGLRTLAQLQAPVDAFFDKVMVMAPEPELRSNRLALLRQLDQLSRSIADISCLPG